MRLLWGNFQAMGRPSDHLRSSSPLCISPTAAPSFFHEGNSYFIPLSYPYSLRSNEQVTREMDIDCLPSLPLAKPASTTRSKPTAPVQKTVRATKKAVGRPPTTSTAPTAPTPRSGRDTCDTTAVQSLQSQFEAQTVRLRDIHRAQRPKNTTKTYEPKQKEWEAWCAKLPGNTDGAWVTEDKLCLFLEQEVVNRESRASGYRVRKAKRKEVWKDAERAKKRARTEVGGVKGEREEAWDEGEWDEEALDAQFSETVRFSVVNSYVSAITELYAWQFGGKASSPPPLRGAKLSAVLQSVRRDEERNRRVNFIDRGLFTIAAGYDVKGLKKAISWCWESASKIPGSVESHLRTAADHLLGLYRFAAICLPNRTLLTCL